MDIEKWLEDTDDVVTAVADGYLDPSALTDERAGRMVAALRAVLDRHPKGHASVIEYTAAGTVAHCFGCKGAHGVAHDEFGLVPWPCPTVRAVTDALGGTR